MPVCPLWSAEPEPACRHRQPIGSSAGRDLSTDGGCPSAPPGLSGSCAFAGIHPAPAAICVSSLQALRRSHNPAGRPGEYLLPLQTG
ncbi:hypothetical protein D3C71_1752410 [compost metagenome]